MRAFLAYYADCVLGAGGQPVVGAAVSAFSASSFAAGTLPSGASVGVAAVAAATTDAGGQFVFAGLPPDDYHLRILYTPPGGAQVVAWRYFVPVAAAEAAGRGLASGRAALLPRTIGRLASGLPVTILALGDDTTVGYDAAGTVAGGWVALLAAQLAAAYPASPVVRADPTAPSVTSDGPIPGWSTTALQAGAAGVGTITVVNAGVKGDTVLRALRRFANVAAWPAVDCAIVALGQAESIATDAQRYETPADFAGHVESLVNVVRSQTQAEVLLCTPHANPTVAWDIDAYAGAVRSAAARLGCDLCDLRQLWADRYAAGGANDGYDPWLTSATSRLFPNDAGHAAIAGELLRHFAPALGLPYARSGQASRTLETVLLPFGSNQVLLTGSGWAPHGGFVGAALNSAGGLEMVTSHAGDTLTIAGRFVELAMLCRRWSDAGQVGVSVDGGAQTVVDLYRGYPTSTSDLADANGASAVQDRVPLAHNLPDAVHTVVITLLASKNAASSGTTWRLESLELGRRRRHGYEVEAADGQMRLQSGAAAVSVAASSTGSQAIAFDTPFTGQANLPVVTVTSQDANFVCAATNITQSGFHLVVTRRDGTSVTATPQAGWLAFG